MAKNPSNSPFLRTSWNFPYGDPKELSVQLDRSYIEIANATNAREVAIYPLRSVVDTGQRYYIDEKQSGGRRQVFNFTAAGNIAHNIANYADVIFTGSFGTFTDGTYWYGATYGATVAGTITFRISSTNIEVQAGAGAPSITNGYIILEWLV